MGLELFMRLSVKRRLAAHKFARHIGRCDLRVRLSAYILKRAPEHFQAGRIDEDVSTDSVCAAPFNPGRCWHRLDKERKQFNVYNHRSIVQYGKYRNRECHICVRARYAAGGGAIGILYPIRRKSTTGAH